MKNRGTAVAERFVKHWRITTLVFFVVGGALVIILRLYMLQVIAYDDYRAIALDQHRAFDELIPRRGEIFAKNGKGDLFPLALNRAYNMAYAVPRDVMETLIPVCRRIRRYAGNLACRSCSPCRDRH